MTKGTSKEYTPKEGTRLASGYTLTTGKNSNISLKLDDNSIVKLAASTKVDNSKAKANELRLKVINGSRSFNAEKQAEGNKTSVKAGNSTMSLRGTLFIVDYIDGVMYVTLLEGELEGITPSGSYIMTAGNVMTVAEKPASQEVISEITPLKIEELDSFALKIVKENAELLIENNIITAEENARLDEMISVAQTKEAAQESTSEQNANQEQGEKVYLTETGNQDGGSNSNTTPTPVPTPVPTPTPTPAPVEPEPEPVNYTVIFEDYDGAVLVSRGESASLPDAPSRLGYEFTGWSVEYDNVTEDLTIVAEYGEILLNSEFTDANFLESIKSFINEQEIYISKLSQNTNLYISNTNISNHSGVEYLVNLEELDVSHNNLTEIDLSGNENLSFLDCSHNEIESLDDVLDWQEFWQEEDLQNCFYPQVRITDEFSDENFSNAVLTKIGKSAGDEIYAADVAGITELEVNNLDISSLSGTAQTLLGVSDNQLTELDVSSNKALVSLDCSYNYMTSTDDVIGWDSIPGLSIGGTFLFDPQK